MSINWVMVHDRDGFVRLPNEHIIWKSSPRTSLSLSTPAAYPGTNPLSIKSDNGTLYLTNQRIVYLPATPSDSFKSFSALHLNLHDSRVILPWFGPNAWQALVQPVPGGNIPSHHHVELKITFKDGGVSDFRSRFEVIKERLHQAVENARQVSSDGGNQTTLGVDMASVHLDQLPSYEDSGHDRVAPPSSSTASTSVQQPPPQVVPAQATPTAPLTGPVPVSSSVEEPQGGTEEERPGGSSQYQPSQLDRPSEAPPGYEETQQHGVENELARRFNTGQS